jgi:pimeloyl-ACP methyl ester carboxylesterase
MTEQMITVNGVTLCVETFGRAADPAILLIHGACASMLGWEEEFCTQLAAAGRYVIRYDQRDTGRATSWPAGAPTYGLRDLARDAVGILDELAIARAHIVGRSMAGGVALILATDHADRVATVTFACTTPGTGPDGTELPGMSPEFLDLVPDKPASSSEADIVTFLVEVIRAYEGGTDRFDERRVRAQFVRDVARTAAIDSMLTNHFCIGLDGPESGGFATITAPTLVIHGDRDPVYPLEHGRALATMVAGANLLTLPDVGHEIPPRTWPRVIAGLVAHTEDDQTLR